MKRFAMLSTHQLSCSFRNTMLHLQLQLITMQDMRARALLTWVCKGLWCICTRTYVFMYDLNIFEPVNYNHGCMFQLPQLPQPLLVKLLLLPYSNLFEQCMKYVLHTHAGSFICKREARIIYLCPS